MSEGKKDDNFKLVWAFCPLSFVAPLVPIFTLGVIRYGFENWKKDFATDELTEEQRFISAMKRHIVEVEEHGALAKNENDGNVYHAAQVAWNALRLLWGALQKEKRDAVL